MSRSILAVASGMCWAAVVIALPMVLVWFNVTTGITLFVTLTFAFTVPLWALRIRNDRHGSSHLSQKRQQYRHTRNRIAAAFFVAGTIAAIANNPLVTVLALVTAGSLAILAELQRA